MNHLILNYLINGGFTIPSLRSRTSSKDDTFWRWLLDIPFDSGQDLEDRCIRTTAFRKVRCMDMGKCFAAGISLLCWAIVTSSSFASISISKYDPLVKKHARRYGFDWRLISAQMYACL